MVTVNNPPVDLANGSYQDQSRRWSHNILRESPANCFAELGRFPADKDLKSPYLSCRAET